MGWSGQEIEPGGNILITFFFRYQVLNMSDSKSGSKENLNESNMPLLSDDGAEKAGETPEKEVVEMELEEKKDDSTEKGDDKKKEKKEKVKKEKKVKVPKEKGPSCIDTLSTGLDLTARDRRGINTEIDVSFLQQRRLRDLCFHISAGF